MEFWNQKTRILASQRSKLTKASKDKIFITIIEVNNGEDKIRTKQAKEQTRNLKNIQESIHFGQEGKRKKNS